MQVDCDSLHAIETFSEEKEPANLEQFPKQFITI